MARGGRRRRRGEGGRRRRGVGNGGGGDGEGGRGVVGCSRRRSRRRDPTLPAAEARVSACSSPAMSESSEKMRSPVWVDGGISGVITVLPN